MHLHYMLNSYESLSSIKKLAKIVRISKPTKLLSGSLQFDYIEGVSAERILLEAILEEDEKLVFSRINPHTRKFINN